MSDVRVRISICIVLVAAFALFFSACAPASPQIVEVPKEVVVEKSVVQTVVVEKQVAVEKEVVKEVEKEVVVTKLVEVEKVVTVIAPPAPSGEQPKKGGKLVVAQQGEFPSFDPAVAVNYEDWIVVMQLYSALYQFDKDGNIYPDVAAAMPEVSADGKVYTIALKQGVKFHDGTELTAEDVKYTYTRTLLPATQSWGQGFLNAIAGAQDIMDGKATELPGVEVVDKYTVKITLSEPQAAFINNLVTGPATIVSKAYVEKIGNEQFSSKPNGTGPYKFVEYIPGQKLVLAANENYHLEGKGPYIDTIEYVIGAEASLSVMKLQAGEVDVLWDTIPPAEFTTMMTDEKFKGWVTGGTVYVTRYLAINKKYEPFNDLRVRQAIAMSVNRTRLARLLQGQVAPAKSLIPPGTAGYDPDLGYDYDPVRAKELLAEAGYPNGFKTELYHRNDRNQVIISAQAVQQDLALVGIQAELKPLAVTAFNALIAKGEIPFCVFGIGANYPDPYDWLKNWNCIYAVEGTWMPEWYCNPEMDALVAEAELMAADPEGRIKKYEQAHTMLVEDATDIYLYNEKKFVGHSPRVKGFFVHPIYWFWWQEYWIE